MSAHAVDFETKLETSRGGSLATVNPPVYAPAIWTVYLHKMGQRKTTLTQIVGVRTFHTSREGDTSEPRWPQTALAGMAANVELSPGHSYGHAGKKGTKTISTPSNKSKPPLLLQKKKKKQDGLQ